jgi:N-acylneuraminate cytidylyltransferase
MRVPSCTAIIPARGGSRGVPRKNVRDLGGIPLVAHAIRAALEARHVSTVWVSTDDPEIAEVARRYGAGVVERPEALAGSTASSESALVHAVEWLREAGHPVGDLLMMIQCTSPLTTSEDLDGAVEELVASGADSCFLAAPFHHFIWERDADGRARGVNHEGSKRKRRQDLEPQFIENGAAYVMRTDLFMETRERFCGTTVVHVVDAARTLEIDDPVDFVRAEATLRARREGARAGDLPDPLHAVVMDFDGVFTDNHVYVFEDGREAVRADRGDGMGLELLGRLGIPMVILSKERNPVVTARARKLGIECHQSMEKKLPSLRSWLEARGLELAHTVYVGNDVNDLECLRAVGCGVVPADAHPRAREAAQVVLERNGGDGALRELCDLILDRHDEASRV